MKVETKIVMKVGGKTLEMTPEEARQLRDELEKVVGQACKGPHYVPWIPYVPNIPPYVPTWTTTTTTDGAYTSGSTWVIGGNEVQSTYTVQ